MSKFLELEEWRLRRGGRQIILILLWTALTQRQGSTTRVSGFSKDSLLPLRNFMSSWKSQEFLTSVSLSKVSKPFKESWTLKRLRTQQNILHSASTDPHLVSLLCPRDLVYKNKEKTRSVLSGTFSSSRDTCVSPIQWSVKIWQTSKLTYHKSRSGEFDRRTFENNFLGGRYFEVVAFQGK